MYADDSQAITAILQGDKDRYEELVEKYKRMVYGIAWSHLGNVDLSEDAAQETFIKAYSYLGTLRNRDRFPGWLARIARNVCHSFGRAAKRESAVAEQWALESSQPHEEDRESLEEQLRLSFSTLPAIHREALTVFYIEDQSLRESAAILGISETALKARLFRARAALRAQLEQRLEDTLESLEPRKDFARSIMLALPLSPKGAVGAGGLLALLGKLFAGLSFVIWSTLAQSAILYGFWRWHFNAEAANIKDDVPGSERAKATLKRGAIWVTITMVTVMVIAELSTFDHHSIFKVLNGYSMAKVFGVYWLFAAWRSSRRWRVNTSPYVIAEPIISVGMGVSCVVIGFHGPNITFPIMALMICAVGYWASKQPQPRIDYNMLVRIVTGGPEDVAASEQLPVQLSRAQLKAFARFLGSQWLISDYRLRGDSLVLILPDFRANIWTIVIKRLSSGSRVILKSDGSCVAQLSPADLRVFQGASTLDAETLGSNLCGIVRHALDVFVRNDFQPASLGPPIPIESLFKQPPGATRHTRLTYLICAIVMFAFLILDLLEMRH
jgi:RNA polymerase sigma factor (sigma-70 family)